MIIWCVWCVGARPGATRIGSVATRLHTLSLSRVSSPPASLRPHLDDFLTSRSPVPRLLPRHPPPSFSLRSFSSSSSLVRNPPPPSFAILLLPRSQSSSSLVRNPPPPSFAIHPNSTQPLLPRSPVGLFKCEEKRSKGYVASQYLPTPVSASTLDTKNATSNDNLDHRPLFLSPSLSFFLSPSPSPSLSFFLNTPNTRRGRAEQQQQQQQ